MNPSKAELLSLAGEVRYSISESVPVNVARANFEKLAVAIAALPDEPAPSPTDECDHDFVLQHSSSINICRNCGIMETPSIAGRMAAKRALKEAFKHFDTPSPTKPMRVWDDTTKTYRWQDVEVSAPTKPEGLEWRGDSLFFNNRNIGNIYATAPGSENETGFTFLSRQNHDTFPTEQEARNALEAAACTWLSPVSDASNTVMEAAAEVIRLTDEYNERLSLYRKAPHLVPEPDSTAALAAFDRLRASLNGGTGQ